MSISAQPKADGFSEDVNAVGRWYRQIWIVFAAPPERQDAHAEEHTAG
jgi:hypothetical protein